MKKADARALIATPELITVLRPALESVIQSRLSPDYILRQARATKAQIDLKEPVDYPSLFLSIYLAPFLGQTNADKTFRAQLWRWDEQLSELIAEGKLSSLIWTSFQALPTARQDQLRAKNKSLRLYAQLFYVLKKPTPEHLKLLAELVTENSAFVSQQLEQDAELRQQYLIALGHCKKSKFKKLTALILQTPVFAKEFVELLTNVMDGKTENIDLKYQLLCQTLSQSILNDPSFANAFLKNSAFCKHNPDLVARLLINRPGAVAEYKAKLESTSWLVLNALKGILAVILPSSLLRFWEPAINAKTLDIIEGTPSNFKPTINLNYWKSHTNGQFNQFRRSSAANHATHPKSVPCETTFLMHEHPPQISLGTPIRPLHPAPSLLASPIPGEPTKNSLDLTFELFCQ